jgi:4-amino-4-deoxy-L-arabinose transferase-like glycosyltransferase
MTPTVKTTEPVTAPSADVTTGRARRWHAVALAAICLVAAALYAWGIGAAGWGTTYYSAAVKSMSASLTNFVFCSFDPLGVVTVDKPPLAFWPMVGSVAVFGYHGWSLLLPQVLEGVAAVLLLHRTVRMWAGERVALLAALVFVLTPVTVAINRDTNPDTLMVLLLVAAAYAFTRSVQRPIEPGKATRWLFLAAVFLGLGFVTKMLQAWIVVPVFALAYLVGSPASVRRRVLDLLGAGAVLLASSLWWVVLVGWWPGPKPYIGSSTDGSVLNLVIDFNGLGRIFDREVGPFQGNAAITRMFGEQVGGQISWLLPLCLLVLVAVAIAGVRQMRSGLPSDPARRAGWVLWGGWLLLVGLVLSLAQGIFHPYYTTEMAPAVAAVTAAGVAAMWRYYRQRDGSLWLLFPVAVTLTVVWAWAMVSRDTSWNGWLRYAVAGAWVVAVVLLVMGRLLSRRVSRVAGVLAVVALLLAPGVWSTATAFTPSGGLLAQAGPPHFAFGSGGEMPVRLRGVMRSDLTDDQRKILAYAQANSGGRRITLAVEGGALAAVQSYLIHSDAAIVGMGGFLGKDPAPTVATLAQWVQQDQLRFVLAGGHDLSSVVSGRGMSAQRTQWVQQHCAVVNPGSYGGSAPARRNTPEPLYRSEVLYDCPAS